MLCGTACSADVAPIDTSGMYNANRAKVLVAMRAAATYRSGELIFMLGNAQEERTQSDTDILFRQDSTFLYVCHRPCPRRGTAPLLTETAPAARPPPQKKKKKIPPGLATSRATMCLTLR